jgi:Ca2+-binding EF-hand superfamily protein
MALFGVGLDFTVKKINQDLKLYIKNKGLSLAKLRTLFNKMDINKNHRLEISEFEKGLSSFGFFMKINDLQALHKMYDLNGDGGVDFDEFLKSIRFVSTLF